MLNYRSVCSFITASLVGDVEIPHRYLKLTLVCGTLSPDCLLVGDFGVVVLVELWGSPKALEDLGLSGLIIGKHQIIVWKLATELFEPVKKLRFVRAILKWLEGHVILVCIVNVFRWARYGFDFAWELTFSSVGALLEILGPTPGIAESRVHLLGHIQILSLSALPSLKRLPHSELILVSPLFALHLLGLNGTFWL